MGPSGLDASEECCAAKKMIGHLDDLFCIFAWNPRRREKIEPNIVHCLASFAL